MINNNDKNTPFVPRKRAEHDKSESKPRFDANKYKSVQLPSTAKGTLTQPMLKFEMYAPPERPEIPTTQLPVTYPYVSKPNRTFLPQIYDRVYAPQTAVSNASALQIPAQQVYNIMLPGVGSGHVEANALYEHILPGKDGVYNASTLGERLTMYDYVRQLLIRGQDGQEMGLESQSTKSLLSFIKLMEMNPNFYSPITSNPYRHLPHGLLLFRSCFPIRLDEISKNVICAKNAIGLNIRVYALSYAEYYAYKLHQSTYKEYDVWRELSYYEYVRENIIKKYRSPNFPILYGFFLTPNQQIDFFKLRSDCYTQKQRLTQEYQFFLRFHQQVKAMTDDDAKPVDDMTRSAQHILGKLPDEIEPKLQQYSGQCALLITEAPHQNLYQWASNSYTKNGIVEHMTSTGIHSHAIWLNVLFQIISALYVMQIHGIYMANMTIEDNVFIKDLQIKGRTNGYWKYVIDGIPYYVPNYGYLILLDSNYKDIVSSTFTHTNCEREFKIYTHHIIGKSYNLTNIQQHVHENYRRIINTNAFSSVHLQNDVMRPPESIMQLIEQLMADNETNLGVILQRHFNMLMNNRIGTYLRSDSETPLIHTNLSAILQAGQMMAYKLNNNLYIWAMVLRHRGNGVYDVITCDTNTSPINTKDRIIRSVRIERLFAYSANESIAQNTTPDMTFSEENLLETYTIEPMNFDRCSMVGDQLL